MLYFTVMSSSSGCCTIVEGWVHLTRAYFWGRAYITSILKNHTTVGLIFKLGLIFGISSIQFTFWRTRKERNKLAYTSSMTILLTLLNCRGCYVLPYRAIQLSGPYCISEKKWKSINGFIRSLQINCSGDVYRSVCRKRKFSPPKVHCKLELSIILTPSSNIVKINYSIIHFKSLTDSQCSIADSAWATSL